MPTPYCSTGEKWDQEGSLTDNFKLLRDKTNGDIVMWQILEERDASIETRLSRPAAIQLGLSIVDAAMGFEYHEHLDKMYYAMVNSKIGRVD